MRRKTNYAQDVDLRKHYDCRTNPCTKDCPDRKAECVRTCPKWDKYEAGRVERYEHNAKVYEIEHAIKSPTIRDKWGLV